MEGNQKKTGRPYERLEFRPGKKTKNQRFRITALLKNPHSVIPLLSGFVMIKTGIAVVSLTILGLITPLWVSAILSLIGCISSMMGGFLIYHTITTQGSFDGLINQAIRRVINNQN